MARFLATLEGRGRPITRTGSENFGASGFAGTWQVRAEARASMAGGTDRFACLQVGLQALQDNGGKANGGVAPKGPAFNLWAGSEAAALDLSGANGAFRQAVALKDAVRHLKARLQDLENSPAYAEAEALHRETARHKLLGRLAAVASKGAST